MSMQVGTHKDGEARGELALTLGAFGLMARMLAPSDGEFQRLLEGCEDLHLAHSIAVDAHKLLNVVSIGAVRDSAAARS